MEKIKKITPVAVLFACFLFFFFLPEPAAHAAPTAGTDVINGLLGKEKLSSSLEIFVLVTLLAFAPAIFVCMTVFPYFQIIFGLTRQGLGLPTLPPNMVINGLAIFVTCYVMMPVFHQINDVAYKPYKENKISVEQAIQKGSEPLKTFMVANTYDKDLAVFVKIRNDEVPKDKKDVNFFAAVPAFVLTQIVKGLLVGMGIVFIFSIIDMIVGSILMFLGMVMLPPQMISLPLKLLVFLSLGAFSYIIEIGLHLIKV